MVSGSSMDGGVVAEQPIVGSLPKKTNPGKVPKKIHKAEREKLKRNQLNELFLELGHALEPAQQNNGKASILGDATRILRDLIQQVQSLRKENVALVKEASYVTVERDELKDENLSLESETTRLRNELRERLQSISFGQVLPPSPPKPPIQVSKPHARYPTPADSWPLKIFSRGSIGPCNGGDGSERD